MFSFCGWELFWLLVLVLFVVVVSLSFFEGGVVGLSFLGFFNSY